MAPPVRFDLEIDGHDEVGVQATYASTSWDYKTPVSQVGPGDTQIEFEFSTGEDVVALQDIYLQTTIATVDAANNEIDLGNSEYAIAAAFTDGLFSNVSVTLNGLTCDDSVQTDMLYAAFARRALTVGEGALRSNAQRVVVAQDKAALGHTEVEIPSYADFFAAGPLNPAQPGPLLLAADARQYFDTVWGYPDAANTLPIRNLANTTIIGRWFEVVSGIINPTGAAIPAAGPDKFMVLRDIGNSFVGTDLPFAAPPTAPEMANNAMTVIAAVDNIILDAVALARAADQPEYGLSPSAFAITRPPQPAGVTVADLVAWTIPMQYVYAGFRGWAERAFGVIQLSVAEQSVVGEGGREGLAFTESGSTPSAARGAKDSARFGEAGANTTVFSSNGTARWRSFQTEEGDRQLGYKTYYWKPQHLFFTSHGLLPPGVTVRIRCERGDTQRLSVGRGAQWPLRFNFVPGKLKLWMKRRQFTSAMRDRYAREIVERPIRIPMIRTNVGTFSMDAPGTFNQTGLLVGPKPNLVCVMAIPDSAYRGSRYLDPLAGGPSALVTEYGLQAQSGQIPIPFLERLSLQWSGGIVRPEIEQDFSFEQLPQFYKAYQEACIGESSPALSYGMFRNYPIYCYELIPDGLKSYDVDPTDQGEISVSVRLGAPPPVPAGVPNPWTTRARIMVIGLSNQSISIDASRTVTKSWA